MISLHDRIKKNNLAISFLLVVLIFVSIGIFTINGLHTLGDLTRRIYEHPLVVSNTSLNAALDITKIHPPSKIFYMINIFDKYLRSVSLKFTHPETSEMGYRTDFEILLKEVL